VSCSLMGSTGNMAEFTANRGSYEAGVSSALCLLHAQPGEYRMLYLKLL
jgi:hypothetical protein